MQQELIKAKKKLSQHFLKDRLLAKRIVDSLNLKPNDQVLEIGYGTGALTKFLVGKCFYNGVELDQSLYLKVKKEFDGPKRKFLNRDILSLDLSQLVDTDNSSLKIVGNLPYGISSPILRHIAHYIDFIDLAIVMLQAEVADRLVATPSSRDYGFLTLFVHYYFDPELLFTVSSQAFKPQPKVNSKVVRLTPRSDYLLSRQYEAPFFQFVKKAFSQRRKTLINCLKMLSSVQQEGLKFELDRLSYSMQVRAEEIPLTHFVELFRTVSLETSGTIQKNTID